MTYNERVRALAEKMAKKKYDDLRQHIPLNEPGARFVGLSPEMRKPYVSYELESARIAVAEMAEAVRSALLKVGLDSPEAIERYLSDEGLIPDDGKDKCEHSFVSVGEISMCAYCGISPFTEDDGQEAGKDAPCPHELRCHTRNHPEGTCDCHNMGLLPEKEAGTND